jgi:Cu(I)-responsive transcriptional regulator
MQIGEVSVRSGIASKTIRYYETIGLVCPARDANGYRDFHENDLHKLVFLARARALGFSIEDCRKLLGLYEDESRESAAVKAMAEEHLRDIDHKIGQLQEMRGTLSHLIDACRGDDRPDCPILRGLSGASDRSKTGVA